MFPLLKASGLLTKILHRHANCSTTLSLNGIAVWITIDYINSNFEVVSLSAIETRKTQKRLKQIVD